MTWTRCASSSSPTGSASRPEEKSSRTSDRQPTTGQEKMISPWVKGSSAGALRYHESLIVVVPEPPPSVKDDLGLPFGQFVQDERARESGDDLTRDLESNHPAQSLLILEIRSLTVLHCRATDPTGLESTGPQRFAFRPGGRGL